MVLHFLASRSCLVGNRHCKKFSYHKYQNLLIYFLIGLCKSGWFKFFCSMANDLLIPFRSFHVLIHVNVFLIFNISSACTWLVSPSACQFLLRFVGDNRFDCRSLAQEKFVHISPSGFPPTKNLRIHERLGHRRVLRGLWQNWLIQLEMPKINIIKRQTYNLVHQYLLRHLQSMFVPGGAAMGLRTEAPNDSFL